MESMKKAVQQAKRIQVKNATISTQISSQRFVLWVSPINPSTSDEELEHFVMDKTGVQPLSVRIRKCKTPILNININSAKISYFFMIF